MARIRPRRCCGNSHERIIITERYDNQCDDNIPLVRNLDKLFTAEVPDNTFANNINIKTSNLGLLSFDSNIFDILDVPIDSSNTNDELGVRGHSHVRFSEAFNRRLNDLDNIERRMRNILEQPAFRTYFSNYITNLVNSNTLDICALTSLCNNNASSFTRAALIYTIPNRSTKVVTKQEIIDIYRNAGGHHASKIKFIDGPLVGGVPTFEGIHLMDDNIDNPNINQEYNIQDFRFQGKDFDGGYQDVYKIRVIDTENNESINYLSIVFNVQPSQNTVPNCLEILTDLIIGDEILSDKTYTNFVLNKKFKVKNHCSVPLVLPAGTFTSDSPRGLTLSYNNVTIPGNNEKEVEIIVNGTTERVVSNTIVTHRIESTFRGQPRVLRYNLTLKTAESANTCLESIVTTNPVQQIQTLKKYTNITTPFVVKVKNKCSVAFETEEKIIQFKNASNQDLTSFTIKLGKVTVPAGMTVNVPVIFNGRCYQEIIDDNEIITAKTNYYGNEVEFKYQVKHPTIEFKAIWTDNNNSNDREVPIFRTDPNAQVPVRLVYHNTSDIAWAEVEDLFNVYIRSGQLQLNPPNPPLPIWYSDKVQLSNLGDTTKFVTVYKALNPPTIEEHSLIPSVRKYKMYVMGYPEFKSGMTWDIFKTNDLINGNTHVLANVTAS